VLSLLNSTDSFVDVIQKFTADIFLNCVSCSTNGYEWTLLTTDIVSLSGSVLSRPPSIGGKITTAGGVDDPAPKARGSSRRRRRDRDAEGVEGVGNGEGVSPSPAD